MEEEKVKEIKKIIKETIPEILKLMEKQALEGLEIETQKFKIGIIKEHLPFLKENKKEKELLKSNPAIKEIIITSNSVGTFHLAYDEETETKYKAGDEVSKEQVVCFIESMNLSHNIITPNAGIILEIFAHEGQIVDYGKPLIKLEVL
ncbi:MAG: hypothetical protein HYU63_02425 [Armatimonadetes bacterium]|nr:hypothetical protein [Armatimonadota bacterium]